MKKQASTYEDIDMNSRPPAPMAAQASKVGRVPQPSPVAKRGGRVNGSGGPTRGPTKLKKIDSQNAKTTPTLDLAAKRKVLPKIKGNVERYDDMLAGSLIDLLPKPPSEVRIFLSSTFSDYRSERNWLTRESFRELQEYCADHDLDFRVVDMRWGVTDDATNEHVTEKLCQSEIATCKRVSLGPNFVAMLGNRYGYQPLPYAFVAKEFEVFYNEAKLVEHPEVEVLHKWYRRDDNNIPPVYCIKPISDNIPNFGNHSSGMEEARRQATAAWGEQLLVIHDVLRSAVTSLASKKIITEARKHDFYRSVTEIEVVDGILEADQPNNHALCYLRYLDRLDESRLADRNALRNIDGHKVDGQLTIDRDVVKYQHTLKEDRVPLHLNKLNIRRYEVPWEDGGVDPDAHTPHKQYIKKFCRDFVTDVQTLISRALDKKGNIIPQQEYYTEFEEALHHAHFCVSKCAVFRGQEGPLGKIKDYLSNPRNRKPLTVYAESGIGKTSILAKAMQSVPKWFGPESICIIRFLGTSPLSGTLYDMLFEVMGQLADNFDMILEPVSYGTIKRITESFPRFLRNISRKTQAPVYIFLDSIDQLSPRDDAFSMKWLPTELPAKIYIVLSMLPNHENILVNTRKVVNDEKSFIEVQPLPLSTGRDIIDSYLKSRGRKVTTEQQKLLTDCLQNEPSPLFLKLFLDKALSWRSITPVDTIRIESSVREAITHLFEDLEGKFGKCLVQRALGYITVGMDGLSELELEDVLSCDDTVLDEVYVYHDPPVQGTIRVPPLLWSRIRIHINEYLTERRSLGKTTLYWYHRQFIEVATNRYARNGDEKILHRRLAELYLSENGVKKDITLTRRKNLTLHKADRQVVPQPMASKNKRMLQCLPFHLSKAQNVGYLKQVALCNLRFLMTRMAGFNVDRVIKDFTDYLETGPKEPDHELEMMVNVLKAAKGLRGPSQLPLQLLARLRHDRKGSPHISNLLDKARDYLENSVQPQVLPLYPCLVNTSELIWSAKESQLSSLASDKTKFVVSITKEVEGKCDPVAEVLVLDAIAQKVVLQKEVHSQVTDIPHITEDGKKLISMHVFEGLPAENNTKKAKGDALLPKVGDFVLDIVEYAALRDGKGASPKLLNLSELKIKELLKFAPSRDGMQVAMVYNESVITLYDVKTATAVKTETHKALCDLSEIRWCGKNYCLAFTADKTGNHRVLILSTNIKKKVNQLQLPGKIKSDSSLWLHDTGELICSCSSDNGEEVIILDLKSGQIKGNLDLPQGKVALHMPSLQNTSSMVLTTEGKLFTTPNGSASPMKECTLEPKESTRQEMTCACEDGSLVLFGDKSGTLYAFQRHPDSLSAIGQTKLSEDPLKSLYLNGDDDLLLSVGQSEIKLWNWHLVKQKLATANAKSSSKGIPAGSSLGSYSSAASFVLSEDGQHLLTVAPSDSIKVWNLGSQEKVKHFGKGVDPKVALLVVGGSILMTLDKKDKKLYAWETETGAELDALKYLQGSILALTKNPKSEEIYIFSEVEEKYGFTILDMTERKIIQTFQSISVKERFDTTDIELALSENGHFLFVKVLATPMQLDILLKSEKKNNLPASFGKFLFYAVDMKKKSGEMIPCKRQLSTVPCLGESWMVHKDSTLIIGRSRLTVIWDVETGTTDQRMSKEKKCPSFYRPEWVEDEADYMKLCHGCIWTIVKSANKEVVATGSEDGWVMFYNTETGLRLGGDVKKKLQPSHQGQVTNVALSADGRWAASYASDMMLKFWCLPEQELASLKLGLTVQQMSFASDGLTLVVLGINGVGVSSILLFRIVGQHVRGSNV